MSNTLANGDCLLVSLTKNVHRDDIVLFTKNGTTYLKRCSGEPGNLVSLKNDTVFLNQEKIDLPTSGIYGAKGEYANNIMVLECYGQNWSLENFGPLIIPQKGMAIELNKKNWAIYQSILKDEGLTRGDYNINQDIPLKGKYIFKNDYFFFLGDNRHHSDDSRIFGFVRREDLIGKSNMVLFSSFEMSRLMFAVH